jgi:hypothetical protein
LLSALFVAVASLGDSLPSQATERVLASLTTFGALPIAALAGARLERASAPWRSAPTVPAPLLTALGVTALGVTVLGMTLVGATRMSAAPDVRSRGTSALIASLDALSWPSDAQLLVEGPFLDAASVVVDSPAPTRAHVEGAGRCPVRVLRCELSCARSDWPRHVSLVATQRRGTEEALRARGWSLRSDIRARPWMLFVRGDGAPLDCDRATR